MKELRKQNKEAIRLFKMRNDFLVGKGFVSKRIEGEGLLGSVGAQQQQQQQRLKVYEAYQRDFAYKG